MKVRSWTSFEGIQFIPMCSWNLHWIGKERSSGLKGILKNQSWRHWWVKEANCRRMYRVRYVVVFMALFMPWRQWMGMGGIPDNFNRNCNILFLLNNMKQKGPVLLCILGGGFVNVILYSFLYIWNLCNLNKRNNSFFFFLFL